MRRTSGPPASDIPSAAALAGRAPDGRLAGVASRDWLETHAAPFVLIDANYTIVAANQAYAVAYGARPDDIVGRTCHAVSHRSAEPCHRHGEDCPHRTVFVTGGPAQVVHVHFDAAGQAERVRLTARPLPLADGGFLMSESVERIAPLDDDGTAEMVGATPAFHRMLSQLVDASATELPLLLTGETGAGKEVAARFVHAHSSRSRGRFVVIDCTAIPESLFESELFGHEKGAFTGPSARRIGLAEEADGGTLLLDEIGELPPAMQAKLLRFIETGEFRRLGSNQTRRVDCRIISATHRVLADAGSRPEFRRDLYYRLAGIEVRVPALRERRADIPGLAAALLQHHVRRTGSPGLSDSARSELLGHDFPGNIRELRNVILRAAQRAGAGRIEPEHLELTAAMRTAPLPLAGALGNTGTSADDPSAGRPFWSGRVSALAGEIDGLCRCGLSRRTIAARLGISERTVYRHLARRAAGPRSD